MVGGHLTRGGSSRESIQARHRLRSSRSRFKLMGIVRQAKPRRAARFAFALAAVLASVGLPDWAAAQGVVKSIYGDWQIRCDTTPAAQKSRLRRVVAPLGGLLPAGLGLKINQADIGRAGFVRCLPNGCVAEVIMDDNLIKQLRNGQTATFIIFQTPEEGIGIPMSLKGFGDGFDKLP